MRISHSTLKRGRLAATAAVLALNWSSAIAAPVCGDLQTPGGFGPFDHRTARPEDIRIVEAFHFTEDVENLARGESGSIGGDLDYTLRAFPNHPRALLAMMKYAAKQNSDKPQGSRFTMSCWFDRAVRFAPDDAKVHMLAGLYALQKGQKSNAERFLDTARKLATNDANLHYNLGLAYADLGQFDKALSHAHLAYGLGFPLPGLKNKLVKANKWREP